MTTDTTEKGLESLICVALTGHPCLPSEVRKIHARPATYSAGWMGGHADDYDREYCLDLAQLGTFLNTTQPSVAKSLDLDQDSITRRKFLARLQGEVTKRGAISVLRNGIKHGP